MTFRLKSLNLIETSITTERLAKVHGSNFFFLVEKLCEEHNEVFIIYVSLLF